LCVYVEVSGGSVPIEVDKDDAAPSICCWLVRYIIVILILKQGSQVSGLLSCNLSWTGVDHRRGTGTQYCGLVWKWAEIGRWDWAQDNAMSPSLGQYVSERVTIAKL
jgi:hypothetical protein